MKLDTYVGTSTTKYICLLSPPTDHKLFTSEVLYKLVSLEHSA